MLSVVIPTFNEEKALGRTLESLRNPRLATEVIVSDGGSTDMTRLVAKAAGARWISGPRLRAAQLNSGARQATGRMLLFLHADTVLQSGWDLALRDQIRAGAPWGAFLLQIDSARLPYRLLEFGAAARTILWDIPFGDQAMFVRRQLLIDVHGFKEVPVMEDVDLALRLRRVHKPVFLNDLATTSARCWESEGIARRTVRNWGMQLAWRAGVSEQRLAELFRADVR